MPLLPYIIKNMQFRKKFILTSGNIQFFIILLGVVLFMIFLSHTPRIMESFFWNHQRLRELGKTFLINEYARLTKGETSSTVQIEKIEKTLDFLKNYHLIRQIRISNNDFADLVDTLIYDMNIYISAKANNNYEKISPAFVQGILDNFEKLEAYVDEHGRKQLFTLQMTNVFIITLMLLMGVSTIYLDLRRRKESRLKEGLRTLHKNTLLDFEGERKKINSTIHDGVLQDMEIARRNIRTLTALKEAETIDADLKEVETVMTNSIKNLRKVLDGLPVWDTASFSFERNIKNMVHELETHIDTQCETTVLGLKKIKLSTREMEQLLSIIHEALYNAAKHANASLIKVKALHAEDKLKIIVHDNGVGFSPRRVQVNSKNKNHIGLLSMQERAWTIAADFELRSSPGRGTKVIVTLDRRKTT